MLYSFNFFFAASALRSPTRNESFVVVMANIWAPPAIFATSLFLFAPSAAIWRISSSIPVSANLARLELFLICVLSGSMQCNNPLILVTGSYKATPTHEPNPSVVNASGHLQTFKSAIPTLIIFPILLFPII